MSTPTADAVAADRRLLAEHRQVGDAEPQQASPRPRRIRSSSPSGSTTCLRSRPGPLDQPVLEHQRRDDVRSATSIASSTASVSTDSVNTRSAVSTFTLDAAVSRPRTPASVDAVSKVPSRGHQDRQVLLHAVESCCDRLRRGVAARQHDRRQMRKRARLVRQDQPWQHVGPVAGRDHRVVLAQPGEHVRQRHGGDHEAERLLVAAISGLPRTSSAPTARCRSATVGATSSGISGIAPTATRCARATLGRGRRHPDRPGSR